MFGFLGLMEIIYGFWRLRFFIISCWVFGGVVVVNIIMGMFGNFDSKFFFILEKFFWNLVFLKYVKNGFSLFDIYFGML